MGAIPEIYQSWNPKHINTDGQMVIWLNPNSIDQTTGAVEVWPDDGNLGYDAEQPVAGEHPGVVQADPVADEPLQVLADRCVEPEPAHPLANGRLLLLGEHVEAA